MNGVNRVIQPSNENYRPCINCEVKNLELNAASKVVFWRGNLYSKCMIIGRNPGRNEDEYGIPFIGKAGKKLDECFLKSINLSTNRLYICNLVKCFTYKNREPSIDMILSCYEKYLKNEIEIKKPILIIGLGDMVNNFLLKEIFKILNYKINEMLEIKNINCYYIPMRHPSYLCMPYGMKDIPDFINCLIKYKNIIYEIVNSDYNECIVEKI